MHPNFKKNHTTQLIFYLVPWCKTNKPALRWEISAAFFLGWKLTKAKDVGKPSRLGLENTPTASLKRGKANPTHPTSIWLWGFSLGVLGNVDHLFTAITPRSTLTRSNSTWEHPIYVSNRNVWHLNCAQANDSS